jgi:MtfA peptidase
VIGFLTRRRRRAIRARPVPASWHGIIADNVPAFARHPAELQAAWIGHAQVLLEEKHWEGCGGLELSEEVTVTIAMHAARLLLGRDLDYFPRVRSILVYPSDIVREEEQHLGDGIWTEEPEDVAGLAATDLGAIVISWEAVLDGVDDPRDGFNVVLHEFAHELDAQDGDFNGAPLQETGRAIRGWAEAMRPAYEAHRAAVEAGEETWLDEYAAEDPTEFFAVLTESFFERPDALRRRFPEAYARLVDYFAQDPAAYSSPR